MAEEQTAVERIETPPEIPYTNEERLLIEDFFIGINGRNKKLY